MPDETTTTRELVPFAMPSLGGDMDEGSVTEWRVAPGDEVHRGDIVAVVETDKNDLDVEVFVDGRVAELVVPIGVRVPVGTVLAMIEPTAAPARRVRPGPHPTPAPAVAPPPPVPAPAPGELAAAAVTGTTPAVETHAPDLHSPVLRHLADAMHVDVAHLHGTGPGGRITRDDIEHAGHRPRISPRARRLARERGLDLDQVATEPHRVLVGDAVLRAAPALLPAPAAPGDAMRRAIARMMARSWQEIPHFQVATTVDVQRPMAALAEVNARRSAADRILPAALLLRAAARAAADVHGVNGWWRDEAFVAADHVDLGIVVALRSGGLLAPVVRDAAAKTLDEVMAELRDLVTRARSGRLRASEVGEATITVTQLGENEVDTVVPIIHPPQVAILGIGAVHDAPWVDAGTVVVRPVVRATLAADHRAVDGRIGSLYLAAFTRHLQEACTP